MLGDAFDPKELFYNPEYYLNNLTDTLKIWQGGMSFHGGLIGVIIASVLYAKKNNQSVFIFTDLISLVAPIEFFLAELQTL